MKNKSNIIFTIVNIILGVCLGLTMSYMAESVSTLIILFLFIITLFFHIIFHEFGHFVCGIISGYDFVSFRIFTYCLTKCDDKLKLKKSYVAGTWGQCLMSPPKNNDFQAPYLLYNLGGIIFNGILALLGLLIVFLDIGEITTTFGILLLFNGILLMISNGLVSKNIPNDGTNIYNIKRDPFALRAFICQLYMAAQLSQGVHYSEIPKEYMAVPENYIHTTPLTATLDFFMINHLLDTMEIEKAKEKCQKLLEQNLISLHKNELLCEYLFLEIITTCNMDLINKLYDKKLQKYINATISNLSRARLMYTYSIIVEKDYKKAEKYWKKFQNNIKRTQFKADIAFETKYMEYVKNIANVAI